MGARYLVCGARDWNDSFIVRLIMDGLHAMARRDRERITVINGAAPGADRIAGQYVHSFQDKNFVADDHPAKWDVEPTTPRRNIRQRRDGTLYDVTAGPRRNQEMLDLDPHVVIAFHDNIHMSKGTLDMCKRAAKAGKAVYVVSRFNPKGDE